jgi:hypothetical protein
MIGNGVRNQECEAPCGPFFFGSCPPFPRTILKNELEQTTSDCTYHGRRALQAGDQTFGVLSNRTKIDYSMFNSSCARRSPAVFPLFLDPPLAPRSPRNAL